jgi:hypothetical protein
LHPDIVKFWNDKGFEIVSSYPSPRVYTEGWRKVFYSKKSGQHADIIGMSRMFPGYLSWEEVENVKCETYFLEKKAYTEEEFLKVIKMIAFA